MNKVLRYDTKNQIGCGGMATVYLAMDEILGRSVAVKMVHPHLLDRPETIQRFANEAKAVAQLSHENVVRIFDYGEENGKRFLVMEYVEGVVLNDLLDQRPPLPALVVLGLMKQILSGLQAAHRESIYHRDIKPGNVMIDKNGCVKIRDFGIAFLAHQESITLTGTFVGSPNYISPEQAEGKALSGKTDVFSVGALAFQCITGAPPFQAENAHATIHRILHEEAPKADQLNPRTLFGLVDIVDKCLNKSISHRPDAEECCALIDNLLAADGLKTGPDRLCEYLRRPKEYTGKEELELYNCYMEGARECSRNGQMVAALRCVNQAKAFAPLSTGDAAFVEKLGRRKRRRDAAFILLKIAAIVFLGFIAQRIFQVVNRDSLKDSSPKISRPETTGTIEISETSVTLNSVPDSATNTQMKESTEVEPVSRSGVKERRSSGEITEEVYRRRNNPGSREDARSIGSKELSDGENSGDVGYLKLRSRPPWAAVRIDGIELGETPVVLSLKPGEYQMKLTKNGYRSVEEFVSIERSDTLLRRIELVDDFSAENRSAGMK